MATKKTAKKATEKVVAKILPFNKANAKAFADNIYSDAGGRVSYLKLCEGDLSDGEDDKRTLHCALGEAYFTFVNANVAGFVKSVEQKFGKNIFREYDQQLKQYVTRDGEYQSKYLKSFFEHVGTVAVIDALVDAAALRKNDDKTKSALALALLDTMNSNDSACSAHEPEEMRRAMDVATTWRKKVLPLLK